jgi:chemotaxis family two-component system sensor kinase Cph1
VRFYIQDNGIGIDPAYYEQVFIMFKRLHSPKSYRGNGIGLAICKKIVQLHGGEIGIHSNSDKGTTFWFTLPRFTQTESSDSEEGSSHE